MLDQLQFALQVALSYAAGFGPLVVIALAILATIFVSIGVGVGRTYWLVLLYLLPFFFFPMSSYGALEGERAVWGRGSGQVYLPLIVWGLLGIFVLAWFSDRYARRVAITTPLHKWFYAWMLLLLCHVCAAAILGESLALAAGSKGIREFATAGIFYALLLRACFDLASIRQLLKLILACVLIRGVFGLVRFLAFGGDPSNVYANSGHIDVKLTFFDINDSLLAMIVVFILSWSLLVRWKSLTAAARLGCVLAILLELIVIVFSYRRTAWGGMAMALCLFGLLIPMRQRIVALLVATPLLGAGVAYAAARRLSRGQGLLSEGGALSGAAYTDRAYEIYLSWQAFLDHPILGIGTWGAYSRGYTGISWQQGPEAYQFLHSGLLHIMVKSGLVGLVLFVGLSAAFFLYVWRNRGRVADDWRGVYFAGLAGYLFLVPSWVAGTPGVEFRTMQLLALCFALPSLALRASASARPAT